MKPLLCGYCRFAKPYISAPAEFIINGQSVCEDHVDSASSEFGRSLRTLQQEVGE